jgi:hypothetical protein
MAMNKVKEECEGATQGLILEFEVQFPKQEIMIALGVVYPLYWIIDPTTTKEIFFSHFNTLKVVFCSLRKIGGLDQNVPPLFSTHMFDLQSSHFKMTMLHNLKVALCEKNQFNPLTRLWRKISTFVVLSLNLSEYTKWLKLLLSKLLGQLKMNDHLSTHLDLCTRFHNQ